MHLARYAEHVSVIVRGGSLATTMSDYLVKTIEATPTIDVQVHTSVIDGHGVDHLENLVLHNSSTGRTRTVPTAALFILIGAQPQHRLAATHHRARRQGIHPHRAGPDTAPAR